MPDYELLDVVIEELDDEDDDVVLAVYSLSFVYSNISSDSS